MEKDPSVVREDWQKLCSYVEQWNIVENRAAQWAALRGEQREEISTNLYDRMIPSWDHNLDLRTQTVVCLRHRTSLHEMVHRYRLCRPVFIYIAAQEQLCSTGPIREVVSKYLALYYSKITGKFDIANFALNYRQANSF